jgi:tetratricopeptide (TPR) repeat protein
MGKKRYFVIILLVLCLLVVFGRIAGNDFINFDDNGYITENYQIQQGIHLQTVQWALTTTYFSYWHPLTWMSHMLDWSLFGPNAAGHHMVSLLLHIGSAILLFLFLYKTTNSFWPAVFATAFFAIHPLRVESVAWASERKDVLNVFFIVACIYIYAFYAENNKLSRYLFSLFLFVLAVMSKPMAVSLPFVLLLLDYWPLDRWKNTVQEKTKSKSGSLWRLIGEKIPFLGIAVAVSIAAFLAQSREGTVASLSSAKILTRVSNAMVSYAAYLEKIFWPMKLAVFYPYDHTVSPGNVMISGTILCIITLIVLYFMKKMSFLFVGWFLYLGTLVPVIGLVQVGSQSMADRYTYLPAVGMAVMAAWGIPSLVRNKKIRKYILLPVGVLVIVLFASMTWQQCGYWKNSVTLFSHSLNVTKNNALASSQLGLAYYEENRDQEALECFTNAIQLEPHQDSAYNNRGAIYLKHRHYEQALADFNQAIAFNASYAKAYNNRANLYVQTAQYPLALNDLNMAIRFSPEYVLAYFNRGIIFNQMGQSKKAIEDFSKVLLLNPNHTGAYHNRAVLFFKTGEADRGCEDAKKACGLGDCQVIETAKANGYCR